MSSSQNEQSPPVSPLVAQPPKIEKKKRVRKMKKFQKKDTIKPLSPEVVVDSEDEVVAGPADEGVGVIAEVVEGITVESAEEDIEVAVSEETSAEIVSQKKDKKGSKYTAEEVSEVRDIIQATEANMVLTNKQLEIAYWIEAEDNKLLNIQRKADGLASKKSEKASFCMTASFDRAFFLELQTQYQQEDGEVYTLQAFQHAINTWFYEHINIGNAYARSGGYKRTKILKSGTEKCYGVNIGDEFFKTKGAGFLQGYLLTAEGKEQMEIGEEAQRIKRTANKSAKGTNKTKEQRARNMKLAMEDMADDELTTMLLALQAKREQRIVESNSGSDSAGPAEEE
tara:strand:- start:54 stop:1073 length:1020 start_codon:yes stop_codon:yes gene_type:complete